MTGKGRLDGPVELATERPGNTTRVRSEVGDGKWDTEVVESTSGEACHGYDRNSRRCSANILFASREVRKLGEPGSVRYLSTAQKANRRCHDVTRHEVE